MKASTLTKDQTRTFGPKFYTINGTKMRITARVRYDDQCGNGHNSFAVTAQIDEQKGRVWMDYSGGCCHDEVEKHFPELRPFIKWHLTSSDGPMHYVANTLYAAGERDYRGLRLGEKRQLCNSRTGAPCFDLVARNTPGLRIHSRYNVAPNAATVGLRAIETLAVEFEDGKRPPVPELVWEPRWVVGEGKARELDLARSSAVWPEATDAELRAEPEFLGAALLARLPALREEFQSAVESLGFTF